MEFRVLGSLEVVDGGGSPIELGSLKLRGLLCVLLLDAGRAVHADWIIEALWGDAPPAGASGTLQVYVSQLRRILEPERGPRAPARVLVTRPTGYAIELVACMLDATEFERLVIDGEQAFAADDPAGALSMLTEAVGLWRGRPFADVADQPYAAPTVARYEQLRLVAVERLLDARIALGRHATAMPELETLVREHPLRERFWAQLIEALYGSGRQAEALRAYQRCRTLLREELGIEPGPELQQLEQAVLSQDPSLGIARPLSMHGSPGPTAAPAGPHTAVDVRLPPLVGRAAELQQLDEAARAAAGHRGRLVVIEGGAGIGKTRLAEAAIERARELGLSTAWVTCLEAIGAPPLWPWHELLAQLGVSDHAAIGPRSQADDAVARFEMLARIGDGLFDAASRRPALLVIDDLQWADGASLDLLRLVASRLGDRSLTVVATCRRPDEAANPTLEGALADLVRVRRVERVRLDGLTPGEVSVLLQHLVGRAPPGVAEALHRRTDGNPFYVSELVKLIASEAQLDGLGSALDEVVPATVRDVVAHRVGRLPEETQRLLRLAAVAGPTVALPIVARGAGHDAAGVAELLEPAVRSGLLVELRDAAGWRFVHPLAQDAVVATLSGAQRARLHAAVAEAIEDVHGADLHAHVEELAHHYVAAVPAGMAAAAFRRSVEAAHSAHERLGYDRAVFHWHRAIEAASAAGRGDELTRYDLSLELATDLRLCGDVDAARVVLEDAIELAERIGSDDRVVRAVIEFGGVSLWNWRPFGVVDEAMVERIERLLPTLEDDARRAELLGTLAVELYYGPRRAEGEDLAAESVAIARELDNPSLLGRTLNNYLIAAQVPEREHERLNAANEALSLVGRGLPIQTELIARLHEVQVALRLGEVSAIDADLDRCEALAVRLSQPIVTGQVLSARAGVAMLRGEWDDAERLSDEASKIQAAVTLWGPDYRRIVQLVTIRGAQGRMAEIVDLAVRSAELDHQEPLRPTAVRAAAEAGDHALAHQLMTRWDWSRLPRDWSWEYRMAEWAEVAIRTGQPPPDVLYNALSPFADRFVVAGTAHSCRGSMHLPLGRLAAATGDVKRAARHLSAAVERNHACGASWWAAQAVSDLSALR